MTIICADDEQLALDSIVETVQDAVPDVQVTGFMETEPLLRYAEENQCDVAFLDIQMRDTNGIILAKQLKDINPKINIIFVTGYDEYMSDAMHLRVSGYVMKPAKKENIIEELENLRHPVDEYRNVHLKIQCFGNFEVFSQGKALTFSRTKAKELLAYLVLKRGTACTWQELAAVLYEDEPNTVQLHNRIRQLTASMMQTLRGIGAENMIIKHGYNLSINTEYGECDYYRFLKMDANAVNTYMGEFMSQYEWAVFVTAFLDGKKY